VTLLEELTAVVTDERDIVSVLAAEVGFTYSPGPKGQLTFQTAATPPEVFAKAWTRNGVVTRLEPGRPLVTPDAQRSLIERARIASAHSHGFRIYHRTLFSRLPIAGPFRWRDTVQLRPYSGNIAIDEPQSYILDRGTPQGMMPRHDGPPFPLILEVSVPDSPNFLIRGNRMRWSLDFWQNVFAVFVPGDIDYWSMGDSDFVGTTVIEDGVARNRLVQQAFADGEPGEPSALADVEPAALDPSEGFYDRIPSTFGTLRFPASLPDDLELLDSLSPAERSAFARASYWFSAGVRARSERNLAVAIVAFSTAIECLLPKPEISRCRCCGEKRGPGPTKLFKEHLNKFAKAPDSLKSLQAGLYAARSALVHGSYAPDIDTYSFHKSLSDPSHFALEWWARKSLINWVRASDRST
jgi:hypothetical protein